ncbi:hypothetical protein FIBSPDRAFT_868334, partial [Athelia psychrophila]
MGSMVPASACKSSKSCSKKNSATSTKLFVPITPCCVIPRAWRPPPADTILHPSPSTRAHPSRRQVRREPIPHPLLHDTAASSSYQLPTSAWRRMVSARL